MADDPEVWLPISEAPGYEVSNLGSIKGKRGKLLTLTPNAKGYVQTALLLDGGKQISRLAHVLAARAFIPNPDNKSQVDHKNRKRHDNRVDNLRWVTPKENAANRKEREVSGRNRKVVQVSNDGKYIQTWDSVTLAAKGTRCARVTVTASCRKLTISSKLGFRFMYIEDYEAQDPDEVWKVVSCHDETFDVSSFGRARAKNGAITFGHLLGKYYQHKNHYIHRLVAEAFLPRLEGKDVVNHKDGTTTNNQVNNLEWVTQKENVAHAVNIGAIRRIAVVQTLADGTEKRFESMSEASRQTGLRQGNISSVCNGKQRTNKGTKWRIAEPMDSAVHEAVAEVKVNIEPISGNCESTSADPEMDALIDELVDKFDSDPPSLMADVAEMRSHVETILGDSGVAIDPEMDSLIDELIS